MIYRANHFYHSTTRSFITAFGSIFDGMTIEKYSDCVTKMQDYVIPIDFSPKNKWLLMVNERPDFTTTQVQITLPRMAFEITDMRPNLNRKMGFNGTYSIGALNAGGRTKTFNPAPYDLTVNLYAITKDNDDMYQIIEQILPYFQPSLTININLLPEMNIYKDIPITLLNVQQEDSYTGSPDEQRTVMTTFTFNAPLYYFGPVSDRPGKIIKDVKVQVTGGTKEHYEAVVTPTTADKTDPHTIAENWGVL